MNGFVPTVTPEFVNWVYKYTHKNYGKRYGPVIALKGPDGEDYEISFRTLKKLYKQALPAEEKPAPKKPEKKVPRRYFGRGPGREGLGLRSLALYQPFPLLPDHPAWKFEPCRRCGRPYPRSWEELALIQTRNLKPCDCITGGLI